MLYESNPKSPDPYAPGREALKRYILARTYGLQSDAAALAEVISTFQSEFAKHTPFPPASHHLLVGKKDS
jgi:hypothetical protein